MAVNSNTVGWIIYAALFALYGVITSVWFYQRRNFQPIRARQPYLVLILGVSFIVWTVVQSIQRVHSAEWPCIAQLWQGYVGAIWVANVFLVRCFILWSNCNRMQEMLRAASYPEMQRADRREVDRLGYRQSWFAKNWQRLSSRDLLLGALATSLVLLIPPLVLSFTSSLAELKGDSCQRNWQGAAFLLSMYALIYLAIFVFFGYKMRGLFDAFHIKEELRAVGVTGMLAIIPWYVFNNLDSFESTNNTYSISTLCLLFGVAFAYTAGIVYPLVCSFSEENSVVDSSISSAPIGTFDELLSNPAGFVAFREFLVTEWSVENLLYWKQIEEYKARIREALSKPAADRKVAALQEKTQEIFETYLAAHAPLEVNLEAGIQDRLKDNLHVLFDDLGRMVETTKQMLDAMIAMPAGGYDRDKLHHNEEESTRVLRRALMVFDESQAAIFKLMATDSYPRFIKSDVNVKLEQGLESVRRDEIELREMGVM